MCGRLGVSGRLVVPGTTMQFSIGKNKRVGIWGIPKPPQFAYTGSPFGMYYYNARSETMSETWRDLYPNRGIVYADYFIEEAVHACGYKDRHPVGMAVIYNEESNFLIVTQDSNAALAHIHNRMPVIVTDDHIDNWVESGKFYPAEDIIEVARLKPYKLNY